MLEDALLSILAGVAGGLTVYLGAELRVRFHLWVRKQGMKQAAQIIRKVGESPIKVQDLPRSKSKYEVVLESNGIVEAMYADNDSQEAQRVYDAKDPSPGQKIWLYKNGKLHDEKEYIDVGVPSIIHNERIG